MTSPIFFSEVINKLNVLHAVPWQFVSNKVVEVHLLEVGRKPEGDVTCSRRKAAVRLKPESRDLTDCN